MLKSKSKQICITLIFLLLMSLVVPSEFAGQEINNELNERAYEEELYSDTDMDNVETISDYSNESERQEQDDPENDLNEFEPPEENGLSSDYKEEQASAEEIDLEESEKLKVTFMYSHSSTAGGMLTNDQLEVYDEDGEQVLHQSVENGSALYRVMTFLLEPGAYTYRAYNADRNLGGQGKFEISEEDDEHIFYLAPVFVTGTAIIGNDGVNYGYDISFYDYENNLLTPGKITYPSNDEMDDGIDAGVLEQAYLVIVTGENRPYYYEGVPKDSEYGSVEGELSWTSNDIKPQVTFQRTNCKISAEKKETVTFKVAKGADLRIFRKGDVHFKEYTEFTGTVDKTASNEYDIYRIKLPTGVLRYEAGGGDFLKICQNFSIIPQRDDCVIDLTDIPKKNISYREDNGFIEDDVYLNVDDSRYLELNTGEVFELFPIRVWQAVLGVTTNDFAEPDYDIEIIGDSVSVEKQGAPGRITYGVTGKKEGVSILKITYDPLAWREAASQVSGEFTPQGYERYFNGIDPINTGIVIVNVGADNKNKIETNIDQREYDTIYYDQDVIDYAEYTFKPTSKTGKISVRVHDPLHNTKWNSSWTNYEAAEDGSYTIHLKEGRNIVEVSAGASVAYHVINAKGLKINVVNGSNPDWEKGDTFSVGETALINFEGLKLPVQKIAAIYNPGYPNNTWVQYKADRGRVVQSPGTQYNVAEFNTISIKMTEPGLFKLNDGQVYTTITGRALDSHRHISESGLRPDLDAKEQTANPLFSTLPDISLSVVDDEYADELAKLGYTLLQNVMVFRNGNIEYINDVGAVRNISLEESSTFLEGAAIPINDDVIIQGRSWLNNDDGSETFKEQSGSRYTIAARGEDNDIGYGEILITPEDASKGYPTTYTFRVLSEKGEIAGVYPNIADVRLDALSGEDEMNIFHSRLKAVADEDLGYGFLSTRSVHETSVPNGVSQIQLTAVPSEENGVVTNVEMKQADGETVSGNTNTFNLEVGSNEIEITGRVGANEIKYTIFVTREGAPNEIQFNTADDSTLVVKARNGRTIATLTGADASCTLPVDKGYTYYHSRPGYLTGTGSFDITAETTWIDLPALSPHNQQSGSVFVTAVTQNNILANGHEVPYDTEQIPDLAFETYVDFNYGGYTVLHALIDTFSSSNIRADFNCYKGIIEPDVTITPSGIAGEGWVCEVNGVVIAEDTLWTTLVQPGDTISFYYNSNYDGMQFAWFTDSEISITEGDSATLTLMGTAVKNNGASPGGIAGAAVTVNRDEGNVIGTTAEGGTLVLPASIVNTPGNYLIKAEKKIGDSNVLTYNQVRVYVKQKSTNPGDPNKTTVSFRLIGAYQHGGGYVGDKNYINWVKTKKYSFSDSRVSVYDLFTKAMDDAGLDYIGADKNYISSIRAPESYGGYWLSEFSNGPYSGWMYTVNSDHPTRGLKNYYLSDGDVVIWHYVDDYTLETYFEGREALYPDGWLNAKDIDPSSKDVSGGSNAKKVTASINITAELKKGGTAEASLKGTNLTDFVKQIDNSSDEKDSAAQINIKVPEGAVSLVFDIPNSVSKSIAQTSNTSLIVASGEMGTLTFDPASLAEMYKKAGSKDVTLAIEKRQGGDDAATVSLSQEAASLIGERTMLEFKLSIGTNELTSLGGEITVVLPYDPKADEIAEGLKAYRIAADGSASLVNGSAYDKSSGGVVFDTNTLSGFAVGYDPSTSGGGGSRTFTDVPESHWAYSDIYYLVSKGVINGITDTTFEPESQVTRAQFVTMLALMSGEELVGAETPFNDVSSGAWYASYIAWAYEREIVKGMSDTTFVPEAQITRQDMAVMVSNYVDYMKCDLTKAGTNNASGAFADDSSVAAYAKEAVGAMQKSGIISGKGDNFFAPRDNATRAEAARILSQILQLQKGNAVADIE